MNHRRAILNRCLTSALYAIPLLTLGASGAIAAEPREELIRRSLEEFEADPRAFMNRLPPRTREPGAPAAAPAFALPRAVLAAPAPWASNDQAEDLVDEGSLRLTTPEAIEAAHLTASHLDVAPWSSSYWPMANGLIAWRYADPAYPASYDWKENADFLKDPAHACSVEQLSPAEKYDLLTGAADKPLTQAMLAEGQSYYDSMGRVATWMGICHGWAPASYMEPRPGKTIQVLASDGRTRIPFYPSDLKALSSLLWANGEFDTRFVGSRCNNNLPPTDENGRITDPACYGENAGTWHLSVVNQIGIARRSFVMDAHHDTEIWNQPLYGYRFSYFNPQTRKPAQALADATIELGAFDSDKFKAYRSHEARSVVGVAMDVTYVSETQPSTAATDSPQADAHVTVRYLYDLELATDHRIVGGEWYTNVHPGFLWTPARDARVTSAGDAMLAGNDWDGESPLPRAWARAIRSSSERGQPLARIVEALELRAALQ